MDESRNAVRLQKVLAGAGLGSRRGCEEFIEAGRVQVNGETITELGRRVDPDRDEIRLDGEKVVAEAPAHYLIYKPKGVVCTTDDQFGRKSVVDLIGGKKTKTRLFPIGRLEEDSEGLIVVTNDGKLNQKLTKERHPLKHVYFVRLRGNLSQEALDRVREGVWLSDGRTGPMTVKVLRWGKKVTTVLASPAANHHRFLRRAFAKVGMVADKVVRVRYGPLNTDGLKKGGVRRLSGEEVKSLLAPPEEARLEGGAWPRKPQRRTGPPSRGGRPGGKRGGKPGGPKGGRPSGKPKRPVKRKKGPGDSAPAPKRRIIGP